MCNCTYWPRGLWRISAAFGCLDCGLEPRRGHGCLSVVSVACFQEEICASGWSLV